MGFSIAVGLTFASVSMRDPGPGTVFMQTRNPQHFAAYMAQHAAVV